MEGKKDEVLAVKAKARADHRKEKLNGTQTLNTPSVGGGLKRDNLGRAYIIDANSSKAILLVDAPQAGKSALSTLHTDPAPTFISFSYADAFEYNTLVSLMSLDTSINWNEHSKEDVPLDTFMAVPINCSAHMKVSTSPFILDSGASIHISPDHLGVMQGLDDDKPSNLAPNRLSILTSPSAPKDTPPSIPTPTTLPPIPPAS
ncbi:hypothetical protein PILCRDRAFT_14537 [Piloderma croceum F 1598]|uniref:Uncharacterized protein n=1 Tax=Piloderma croceum (strain F 1598) TaxID=765440 RepID=A0A0C3F2H1_PILCF|nr:hypothetical protein PILCRDRAFT_14537 [Piloderma croceum F 1598]